LSEGFHDGGVTQGRAEPAWDYWARRGESDKSDWCGSASCSRSPAI